MRLLLINTNTTAAVTEKIAEEAEIWAGAETEICAVTARFGAQIVSSRAEAAISQHALLDACALHGANADAIIVGMSLDSGVWAAREAMDIPVIGMSEAALHIASLHGNRIGYLVFGNATRPYVEMIERYGFQSRVAAVEALRITPEEHLSDPAKVERRIVRRTTQLGEAGEIDSVILVGAVAAGLPARLRDQLPVPAFEGISCAVMLAETLVKVAAPAARLGSFARAKNRSSQGLSAKLAAQLKRA